MWLTVLLGGIKRFFSKNWQWLLPTLLALIVFFWIKEHYYTLGRTEEKAVWEERIRIETEKNKKLTEVIASAVTTFGKAVQELEKTRVKKEIVHENRINTIIQEKPIYNECRIDLEVLESLNSIKALGPQP